MSVETVKEYLKRWEADTKVMEFNESSATVELAAKALDVIPARIAKTLSFKTEDGCMLIVTAGDTKIDNKKFKACFGFKAKMPSFDEVAALTGHPVGGVCPFALKDGVTVYTDISLKRFESVFPACGSANSAIELNCEELYEYSHSLKWVDVCKILDENM